MGGDSHTKHTGMLIRNFELKETKAQVGFFLNQNEIYCSKKSVNIIENLFGSSDYRQIIAVKSFHPLACSLTTRPN